MLVFLIRQLVFLKRAILGRRQPHQLAGGLAMGVWLAMVPPGNLLSLLILLAILALRINQGMAALSAVLMSVVAARLDTHTDALGRFVLTHPSLAQPLATLWQWPLVPWTDLNNTVVMGGLLAGLACLPPSYLIGYLVFSKLAPPASPASPTAIPAGDEPLPVAELAVQQALAAPQDAAPATTPTAVAAAEESPADPLRKAPQQPADASLADASLAAASIAPASIADATPATLPSDMAAASPDCPLSPERLPGSERPLISDRSPDPDRPPSEALNYLLHQLRQSRQGRAA